MIYNSEEKVGLYSVAKIFTEKLKWIFREQPVNDFGIDGVVEITKVGLNLKDLIPTGKLIGVQIKSGKSFFKELKDEYIVFRGSKKHLGYWLNYAIPIILILYDKTSNTAYWEEINSSTITLTRKSFKVYVSKKSCLNYESKDSLTSVGFFKDVYQYKLWQLQSSAEEIYQLFKEPLFLYVGIGEVYNSDQYSIELLLTNEDCENGYEIMDRHYDENPIRFNYYFSLPKEKSLKEAINDILPWGHLYIGNISFTDELLTEDIANTLLNYNQKEFFEDVLKLKNENSFLKLACYLTGDYCFKLELKSNELAQAFLTFDKFLNKEPIVKQRLLI